jgi:hypothetical protein
MRYVFETWGPFGQKIDGFDVLAHTGRSEQRTDPYKRLIMLGMTYPANCRVTWRAYWWD